MGFIAVLDYGIGNLRSAQKALEHVGADARLITVPAEVEGASGVVLPGVGAFGACVTALRESGLEAVALRSISDGLPFLGVCVGMQMLYAGSDESPGVDGLGFFDARISRLGDGVKHPQMQWNRLEFVDADHPMAQALPAEPWVYFVHSYAAADSGAGEVVATCNYPDAVVAAVARDNVWAVQFHPEKSGPVGLALLSGFVDRCDPGRAS
ncbi:MAG: imidazole glycerol phosphate synthase subunit HisH [Acidimicrobiales bacterium]